MGTHYGFFVPHIVNLYMDYDPFIKLYVTNFLVTIFFFNAIINPIIYGWMSPDFNHAFRRILGLKSPNKKVSRTATSYVSVTQQANSVATGEIAIQSQRA